MVKKNYFKYFVTFILTAIFVALFSVSFIPANVVAGAENFVVNSDNNIIKSIEGDFVGSKIESANDVFDYLENFKEDFKFTSASASLKLNRVVESLTGEVYKFDEYVDDVRVYGGELNVSVNRNKRIKVIDGKYFTAPVYDNTINYSQQDAMQIVQEKYKEAQLYCEELVILLEDDANCLTYIVKVDLAEESLRVFVSAQTGQIVKEVGGNTLVRSSISANGYNASADTIEVTINDQSVTLPVTKYTSTNGGGYFYALSDATASKIYMTNGQHQTDYSYVCYDTSLNNNNPSDYFTDNDALKAYSNLLTCYNFYADIDSFGKTFFGIQNGNNKTIDLIAIVHFGSSYENAGYVEPAKNNSTGKYETYGYFIFGDGKAGSSNSFVNGLDIVGHEYQHAITSSVTNFEYSGESGALAEAFSDMFGAVIEGKGIESSDFWKLGEDVVLNGTKYLRNMANPSATGCVSNYSQIASFTRNKASDYGGVHYICTLPTYATYLMYKKNPTFFTEYNILQLWYQTLTHLTSTSGVADFCSAMITAAEELEYSSEIIGIIDYAFASVGVPGYSGIRTWNNNSLTTLQGAGTLASPYLINSAADLASLAYYVNNGEDAYLTARYKLNTDISLSGVKWTAIGTASHPFNGYFNGSSHTVSGLNLQSSDTETFAGLFAYVGENGYIYDLNIGKYTTTSQAEYVGAIVGKMEGTITGCSSLLNITGTNVGGIVGLMVNRDGGQRLTNSFVQADLVGETVGGLICTFATYKNQDDNIYESAYVASNYFQGNLTGTKIGGLIAIANGIYLANNLVYATVDGRDESAQLGGLIASLDFKNLYESTTPQNVYNYVLTNRVYVNFKNAEDADKGLLIASLSGTAIGGRTYISGNIVKLISGLQLIQTVENDNAFKAEDNKISTDTIFSGDFDFDNASYFKNQEWTVLTQISAFDLTGTFKINKNQMPTFKEMEFWISSASYSFDGGNGSVSDPYQIATAEQLAALANCMTNEYNHTLYASKHYILTADIDLSGKIWAGIGVTRYMFINNVLTRDLNGSDPTLTLAFTGTFDGNGHTIKNMTTLGLYSIGSQSNDGNNFYLYEFMPALFGLTSVQESSGQIINTPTIKNVTLQNISSSGNYAASVVSRAYAAVTLQNVKAIDGKVMSNGVAGGLVGRIEGIGASYSSNPVSNITDCYTYLTVSGVIAGGAIGYATNATTTNDSTLNVINFLNRSTVNVIGSEIQSYYNPSVSAYGVYYLPAGGSVLGVALTKNINLINCINFGNIVTYTQGAYLGAYIGTVGVGDMLTKTSINIVVDSCKNYSKMYYIMQKDNNVGGNIIGGTYDSLTSMINLSVNDKTYTNQSAAEVYYNNSNNISVQSSLQISEDAKGQGDFDIYNDEYYTNETYFNLSYAWTEDDILRLGFLVTFMLEDGTILKQDVVMEGGSVTPPETVPTKASTLAYDFEFVGYSQDFSNITKDTEIYAVFNAVAREYKVTYEDENGNVIAVLSLKYGDSVDQDIEYNKKQSNLFIKYTFLHFGEENQTVTGDMVVRPVYKTEITSVGVISLFLLFSVCVSVISIVLRRKKI